MANFNLVYIISSIVCETFMSVCGKWQSKKTIPQAFLVKFNTKVNYETEEGYRWVELALYAKNNYVSVYTRELWNVIPIEDLEYNEEEDESYVKKGKDYNVGNSGWNLLVSHDSCWRDEVKNFFTKNANVIETIGGGNNFYTLVNPSIFEH